MNLDVELRQSENGSRAGYVLVCRETGEVVENVHTHFVQPSDDRGFRDGDVRMEILVERSRNREEPGFISLERHRHLHGVLERLRRELTFELNNHAQTRQAWELFERALSMAVYDEMERRVQSGLHLRGSLNPSPRDQINYVEDQRRLMQVRADLERRGILSTQQNADRDQFIEEYRRYTEMAPGVQSGIDAVAAYFSDMPLIGLTMPDDAQQVYRQVARSLGIPQDMIQRVTRDGQELVVDVLMPVPANHIHINFTIGPDGKMVENVVEKIPDPVVREPAERTLSHNQAPTSLEIDENFFQKVLAYDLDPTNDPATDTQNASGNQTTQQPPRKSRCIPDPADYVAPEALIQVISNR